MWKAELGGALSARLGNITYHVAQCRAVTRSAGAVGTRVTSRPPHRPVLAAFPHTVPTSGTDNQALRLDVCSPALALALRPVRGGLVRIPLGPCPSLHRLRRSDRLRLCFVRRFPRYYDRARLPTSVHHRLRLLTFPMRATSLIG